MAAFRQQTVIAAFPNGLRTFAALFADMQDKRHLADYDPSARFTKAGVLQDASIVERAIEGFLSAPERDRRALCTLALFKKR